MITFTNGVSLPAEQLRQACAELVQRLREGEPCRAEDFFTTQPALTSHEESALELIYTEFVVREELGQQPLPNEYYSRFPQWRMSLERLFHVGELLHVNEAAEPITLVETPRLDHNDPATPGEGFWLDRYDLLERLGRGGMGVVYKARQVSLDRIVALKMIRAGEDASPEMRALFRREAEAMARLKHSHIVQIYTVGECDGLPCFSMEYVDGGNLSRRIAGQAQPARQTAQWVESLALAVHYAHQQGIIHRDLKPSNVVLTADGVPKITDFGLAKRLEAEGGLSFTGAAIGTPSYISPEQAAGRTREIGPLSDVYSLGAILYELLTGKPPFKGKTHQETLQQVQGQEPIAPRVHNPNVDRELEAICLKCLEKDSQRRYASAEILAEDLGRWLRGKPTLARPPGWKHRVVRILRRRSVKALLALAAVLLPVALILYYQHPARHLKYLQDELGAGRAVMPIAQAGKPKWFRVITNDADAKISLAPDGTFRVTTEKIALVEILPDPHLERFRYRAEIRHDDWFGLAAGEVGIYFLHSQHDLPDGEKAHFYGVLGFNDQMHYYDTLKTRFPNLAPQGNPVKMALRRCKEPEETPAAPIVASGLDDEFAPMAGKKIVGPWRKVVAEVTPETIRIGWAANLLPGELSRDKLMKITRSLINKPAPLIGVHPGFSPRGGLGLYVCRGAASFRLVVVEPLGDEN